MTQELDEQDKLANFYEKHPELENYPETRKFIEEKHMVEFVQKKPYYLAESEAIEDFKAGRQITARCPQHNAILVVFHGPRRLIIWCEANHEHNWLILESENDHYQAALEKLGQAKEKQLASIAALRGKYKMLPVTTIPLINTRSVLGEPERVDTLAGLNLEELQRLLASYLDADDQVSLKWVFGHTEAEMHYGDFVEHYAAIRPSFDDDLLIYESQWIIELSYDNSVKVWRKRPPSNKVFGQKWRDRNRNL